VCKTWTFLLFRLAHLVPPRVDVLFQDMRFALRWFRANPGFAGAAILVLSLGIGASTATFSIVHAVALRPLAFDAPERIIRVWSSPAGRNLPFFSVSAPDFADWRARTRTLELVAAYERQRAMSLTGEDEPEQVFTSRVGADLFALLGIAPSMGRWFSADEDRAGASSQVAVVSHGVWQRRFAGRDDVIGRMLRLDGEPWEIVGVMPAGFAIPNNPAEIWLPLQLAIDPARRSDRYLRVLGRLKPGVDVERARRELEQIAATLEIEHPATNRTWTTTVMPITDTVVGDDFRRALMILSAAVGLVLLIACANVGSLLLSRAAARRREMAVRSALGASRIVLVQQMLIESLMLAGVSGLVGVLLSMWGLDALQRLGVDSIPRVDEVALRAPVIVFACLVTAMTAIIFGVAPALTASRGVHSSLRSRDVTPDRRTSRGRDALVLGEVVLAVILLVAAGLMVRSFVHLQQRSLGFNPDGLLVVEMTPAPGDVYQGLIDRIGALPGVESVAAGSSLPFAGPNSANRFAIDGMTFEAGEAPDTDFRIVTGEYFRAIGIPLLRGRTFITSDGPNAPAVIISETVAHRYFANEDPIGRRIRLGNTDWMTVVGIAGDVRYMELDDPGEQVRPMMYVPQAQMPASERAMTLAVRSLVAPESLAGAVRNAVRAHAPSRPIVRMASMEGILAQARGPQRFNALVLGLFAWIGVVLAAAGLWALIAYGVARRTHEIGVRVALGASPAAVLRLIAGRGVGLAGAGVLLGLGGAALLTRAMDRLLFGVSATDPATFAGMAALFIGVALGASLLPARGALRVDPATALRSD
jgi:putative ABC transport system permease protein